jgi:hypothetical protein
VAGRLVPVPDTPVVRDLSAVVVVAEQTLLLTRVALVAHRRSLPVELVARVRTTDVVEAAVGAVPLVLALTVPRLLRVQRVAQVERVALAVAAVEPVAQERQVARVEQEVAGQSCCITNG